MLDLTPMLNADPNGQWLLHRQAIRLTHKKDPVRVVIIGATQARRLLRIILQFHGRERYFEDKFWTAHALTDLELEEDPTPLVIERGALRHVKKIEVANPTSIRPWKRKTA
jgi:hypothetical protein